MISHEILFALLFVWNKKKNKKVLDRDKRTNYETYLKNEYKLFTFLHNFTIVEKKIA